MQRKALFFGIAFLIIGGCLLVFGWIGWKAYAGASDWPTVKGRVVEKRVESHPGTDGTSYTPVVLYRFQIGEEMYSGEHSFNPEEFRQTARRKLDHYNKGSVVTIYHHPHHPERSTLDPQNTQMDNLFMMLFGLLGMAGGTAGIAHAFSSKSRASS